MTVKRYVFLTLFLMLFSAFLAVLALGLQQSPPPNLLTQGQLLPEFSMPDLHDDKPLNNGDLSSDKPYYLLNVWGSWCPECYREHAYLQQLSQTETIYGINWKDDKADALHFLQAGNPYRRVIVDAHSQLAIALGVIGAPETFLIRRDGTVITRYVGALNAMAWQQYFQPQIEALQP